MTMLLKAEDEKEFELALITDRLPDTQDGFCDTELVTASFRVATADESWEETAPCLNLFEFSNLADWLAAVADRTGDEAEVELLEPDLRFLVVKDMGEKVTLRIGFHLKDRPEEFAVDAETDAKRVDLLMSRDRIRTAAEQLRHDLAEIGVGRDDDSDGAEDLADLGQVRTPDEEVAMREEPMGAGEGEGGER